MEYNFRDNRSSNTVLVSFKDLEGPKSKFFTLDLESILQNDGENNKNVSYKVQYE